MWQYRSGFVVLVALAALFQGQAYGAFNPLTDPSIVGWWACDEGEGSVVADASPNGNNGTFVNGSPVWVEGIHGSAVELTIPTLIEIPAVNITMTAATMAGWIKPYGAQPDWAAIMMTRGTATGLNVLADYQLAYHWGDTSTSWSYRSGAYVVNNEWSFAAVTIQADKATFYLNGVQAAVNTAAHASVNWNANIYLGGDGTSAQSARRMTGALDDVSLFTRALTADEIVAIMAGLPEPTLAVDPVPANGATDVPRDISLSWTPSEFAATHNVYFGTSLDEVTNAAQPTASVTDAAYDPEGLLEFGKTYYWRIDEVNAAPDLTVFKGDVWSFTAEPFSYAIDGGSITATASSSSAAGMGPENTVNGSGLNADGQHSTTLTDMWLSSKNGPQPTWIQWQFDKTRLLDKMLVWNSNQLLEPVVGFGVKTATIEYSVDDVSWTTLGDFELAQAIGQEDYEANTTVEFGQISARYVKLTVQDNWGGMMPQYSLSEVQFYAVPMAAREPSPAVGATGVAPEATLSWRAGRGAASHQVYLSKDKQAVIDGTAPMVSTLESSYDAVVDLTSTYYWKVVEVNQANDPATWEGEVWSFSTADSIVVDDFESYTDSEGGRVYEFWIDGWDDETNGSTVGYAESPFAEQTTIHGGKQAMPLAYDNTGSATTSEATLTFESSQDWTKAGVTTLSLWFYGASDNATNLPLWVKVTDASNKSAKVTFGAAAGEDATALAEPAWTEWNIPLSSLANVNLARVASITIGLGSGTGSGLLLVDDIQLYPARQTPVSSAVLVAHWLLDNNVLDSSGNGNNGTISGNPTWAAAGRIGASLTLDGIDDYVNFGNGASLNITDQVTVSAWIKTEDAGNSEHNPYVAKGDTSYALKQNTNNIMEFFIYDGAWYAANSQTLETSFNGTWHHVAGTYDGVQVKLYIDGVLVGSKLHTGDIDSVAYDVNIGRDSQNTDRFYDGQIDDVRIYHGALPKSEIVKLANP
ncbi:MAG: LamG-like jellyroll fold domain-containing protein [Solirubrobacterales bacterium]